MAKVKLNVDTLISIDETGLPCAPNLRQLLDKDVKELYKRDPTPDKIYYLKECGVIYYLGDPKSPPKQQGLSDAECIKEAISNFDLPKNYSPDVLVLKLAKRYYEENITPAGVAIEVIQTAIHNETILIKKCNEILNEKLNTSVTLEEINMLDGVMKSINSKASEIPELAKKLEVAKENLMYEKQNETARGGSAILSSMDADEYDE